MEFLASQTPLLRIIIATSKEALVYETISTKFFKLYLEVAFFLDYFFSFLYFFYTKEIFDVEFFKFVNAMTCFHLLSLLII